VAGSNAITAPSDEELHDGYGIDDFEVCVENERLLDLRMRIDGAELAMNT
jgi:hypothetical protein